MHNAVTLVWGLLKPAPTRTRYYNHCTAASHIGARGQLKSSKQYYLDAKQVLPHKISINPKVANFRLLQCLHLDPEETRPFKNFFLLRSLCNTLTSSTSEECWSSCLYILWLVRNTCGFVGYHAVKYSLTVRDIHEPWIQLSTAEQNC